MADELSFLFRWRAEVLSKDCDLSSTGRLVALAISMRMNSDGGSAFPGGTEISDRTALSLRTIRRAEVELVSSGWLMVIEQGGSRRGSRRQANHYAASFPTTDDTESLVTDDTESLVNGTGDKQDTDRCQNGHGPVSERHSKKFKNSNINKPAPAVDKFPPSLLVLRHEESALHEVMTLYPDDPDRQAAAMDAWHKAQPQPVMPQDWGPFK